MCLCNLYRQSWWHNLMIAKCKCRDTLACNEIVYLCLYAVIRMLKFVTKPPNKKTKTKKAMEKHFYGVSNWICMNAWPWEGKQFIILLFMLARRCEPFPPKILVHFDRVLYHKFHSGSTASDSENVKEKFCIRFLQPFFDCARLDFARVSGCEPAWNSFFFSFIDGTPPHRVSCTQQMNEQK